MSYSWTVYLTCVVLLISTHSTLALKDSVISQWESQLKKGSQTFPPSTPDLQSGTCTGEAYIVESIPSNLTISTSIHTVDAWLDLINNANATLDIAVFYMTLLNGSTNGMRIFDALIEACSRGVFLTLALSSPTSSFPDDDVVILQQLCAGHIEVTQVNMTQLFGAGVMHTKFIIADLNRFYVGSANMDWRSLDEVKELGVLVNDCSLLSRDLFKTFELYSITHNYDEIPEYWPSYLETSFNYNSPALVFLNDTFSSAFFSSSPEEFCPAGRTVDITALQVTLLSASTICIEVMDYLPTTLYLPGNQKFWPDLDNAIRMAVFENKAQVKMLIAKWNYTDPSMNQYLKSLNALDNVEVRNFIIPQNTPYVPFTRVNHAKFIVTDILAAFSTSNYVGDYFIDTAGVSFVTDNTALTADLQNRFDRDWNSDYSFPLQD